jgi:hypothetical protein
MRHLPPALARRRFKDRLILTLGLRRKPLRLFCEHCGKFIPSDLTWFCGYCNNENIHTKIYSFLNKCEECKRAPQSLHCPHCGEPIFFGKSRNDGHPAWHKLPLSPPPPRLPETREQTEAKMKAKNLENRQERRAELEYEIVCAKLDNELAALKKQGEMIKGGTPEELLERDFLKHDAHFMAVHKIANRKLEAYKKEFAHDSDLLEKGELSVEMWRTKHI